MFSCIESVNQVSTKIAEKNLLKFFMQVLFQIATILDTSGFEGNKKF
jgi:hypothetical protein